jgi:hypothetical protein
MLGVYVDTSYTPGPPNLALPLIRVGFRVWPPYLALLAGGLGTSIEARQPLELKRSARDRTIV